MEYNRSTDTGTFVPAQFTYPRLGGSVLTEAVELEMKTLKKEYFY